MVEEFLCAKIDWMKFCRNTVHVEGKDVFLLRRRYWNDCLLASKLWSVLVVTWQVIMAEARKTYSVESKAMCLTLPSIREAPRHELVHATFWCNAFIYERSLYPLILIFKAQSCYWSQRFADLDSYVWIHGTCFVDALYVLRMSLISLTFEFLRQPKH